jgi:uncharacterized protein YecT (DUF1311 family)
MKKFLVSFALVIVPLSSYALSQEYEKCVNAEGHGTVDMCASKEYEHQSKKMEKIYKQALKTNPSISKNQKKWLKQLDKDCPELSGTTFAFETWSKCLAEKTEERIVELQNGKSENLSNKVKTLPIGSNDRKFLMDTLRVPVQAELKVPVQFVIYELRVLDNYAFLMGNPTQKNGKPINYSKTTYKDYYESEAFDDSITALFHKVNGSWEVMTYNIGATDVVYACWWKEYNVPKAVFPYTEDGCHNLQ